MSGMLETFGQMNLLDSLRSTFSPESESGVMPPEEPDGPTPGLSGPRVSHASLSARQAKEQGLLTSGTYGRRVCTSSASAALQSSLASRLQARTVLLGSTLFNLTWKQRVTPSRRSISALRASALRTSGSGCTSVPTAQARDWKGKQSRGYKGESEDLPTAAMLASVPTPMAGSPATETYNAAGNSDYSRRIVELAHIPTPQAHDTTGRSENQKAIHGTKHGCACLVQTANLSAVPTPDTGMGPHGRRGTSRNQEHQSGRDLEALARLSAVPTPQAMDTMPAKTGEALERAMAGRAIPGRNGGAPRNLREEARLAAVTTPSDWKDTSGMSESGVDPDGSARSRLDQLPRQAQLAASGPTATGGTAATRSIGQLDPAYSRWLMGLPPEWDDCAVTAMQSLPRSRRRSLKP